MIVIDMKMVCEMMKVERRGKKEFLMDLIDEMMLIGLSWNA